MVKKVYGMTDSVYQNVLSLLRIKMDEDELISRTDFIRFNNAVSVIKRGNCSLSAAHRVLFNVPEGEVSESDLQRIWDITTLIMTACPIPVTSSVPVSSPASPAREVSPFLSWLGMDGKDSSVLSFLERQSVEFCCQVCHGRSPRMNVLVTIGSEVDSCDFHLQVCTTCAKLAVVNRCVKCGQNVFIQ